MTLRRLSDSQHRAQDRFRAWVLRAGAGLVAIGIALGPIVGC